MNVLFRNRRAGTVRRARSQNASLLPVSLLALSTAVPSCRLPQGDAADFAERLFAVRPEVFERMRPAYANAGIETRHSCVPLEWFAEDRGWRGKNQAFLDHAVDLLEEVTRASVARAGMDLGDIDAIVAVSTTGVATPSLDALVMERLGLRRDVTRLPVFGLGCAGGVLGLARAAALARSVPGSRVLLLVVELCTLTLRTADLSKGNIIATALFGDGAVGAILSTEGAGPRLTGWGEWTWPNSLDVMGWEVEDDGLGVLFSRDIPALVRTRMRDAAEAVLAEQDLTLADIDRLVCHPGGAKVIVALEEAFDLAPGTLGTERQVLQRYGNMSAATVLFVLQETLSDLSPGFNRLLLSALGPGFTAGFATMEVAA